MESIDSIWQVGILALLAGIMIGLLGYRLFGRSTREGDKVQAELDAARQEFEEYRVSVNEHFDKTSELVNDLTQNYVRVYQHLAEGATTLGDGRTFNNLLERQPGKVSLTVDGGARPSETDFDDSVVEAAAPADVPPQPAAAATGARPEESAAESAAAGSEEPVSASTAAEAAAEDKQPAGDAGQQDKTTETESAAAASGAEQVATADASAATAAGAAAETPAEETDKQTGSAEPELNVDALDETADKKSADAAGVLPEGESKPETSRTVH